MSHERADVGWHDDRDRGADTELKTHLLRHFEHAENLIEYRHDQRAAADAEQAGQNAGDGAARDNGEREPCKLAERDTQNHERSLAIVGR